MQSTIEVRCMSFSLFSISLRFKYSSQHIDCRCISNLSYSILILVSHIEPQCRPLHISRMSSITERNSWSNSAHEFVFIYLYTYLLHKTDVERNTQYRNTALSCSVIIIPTHHCMFSKQYHKLLPSQSCSKNISEPLQYA